ncbi:hypothetical protein OQA88_7838 [Cercophora sp. LCS_1]
MGITLDLHHRRDDDFDFDEFSTYFRGSSDSQGESSQSIKRRCTGLSDGSTCTITPSTSETNTDSYEPYNDWYGRQLTTLETRGQGGEAITIHNGIKSREVPVTDLLSYFWTDLPDDECITCTGAFSVANPPVRTISSSLQPSQDTGIAIQVHTRHFACLKQDAPALVTVSHVWEPAVAEANMRGSGSKHGAAAQCLYRVINKVLPAATEKFQSSCGRIELWHDYLSVPQWRTEQQQSLLLLLPEIYATATLCLIQLDDVPTDTIINLAAGGDVQTQYKNLASFFRAKWFKRMWVSLEYAHCRRAFAYTMDDEIIGYFDDTVQEDPFSYFLEGSFQQMRRLIEETTNQTFRNLFKQVPVPILGPFMDMRQMVRQRRQNLTFGEALAFVAGRDCQCYRDRFVAMSSFLNGGTYSEEAEQIPLTAEEACIWLARKCLARGDYTPLLLLRTDERPIPGAVWVVGHESMAWHMWDLGAVTSPPKVVEIGLGGGQITLDLQLVGHIETFYQDRGGFRKGDAWANLDCIISIILIHQDGVDASAFVSTLERIFPIPEPVRTSTTPITWAEYQEILPGFEQQLESLIRAYLRAPCQSTTRSALCRNIAGLLRFSERLGGALNSFSRLTYGRNSLGTTNSYTEG